MFRRLLVGLVFSILVATGATAQNAEVDFTGEAELMGWGSINGIRLSGELFPIRTSIRVVSDHWDIINETAQHKREQMPSFVRVADRRLITTTIEPLSVHESVTTLADGVTELALEAEVTKDTTLAGVYFFVEVPASQYANGLFGFHGSNRASDSSIVLDTHPNDVGTDYVRASVTGFHIGSIDRQLSVEFGSPTEVIVRTSKSDTGEPLVQTYATMMRGEIAGGTVSSNTFTLRVSGSIDTTAVEIVVDPSRPGRRFDGIGGNFRIQQPDRDSMVVAYNLDNLDVTWGRVELPWHLWHAEEDIDPTALADSAGLHPRVKSAMQMARTLARKHVPVVVSAWFPPDWAILPDTMVNTTPATPASPGLRGHALDDSKLQQIAESIADYLLYLKQVYGVEAELFSFNESDLGIDIRQTAEEHSDFIVLLGEELAERRLATKLLLGDTSNAHATTFVDPAINNKDTHPYIGAVSFHSWSGWSDSLLSAWGTIGDRLNVPVIVGEASTDASAYTYPGVFSESHFALNEIKLYTRILALVQPRSILQWQLTADYSVLRGGGLYGVDDEPLSPTQRFWNLKQLAATPARAFWLPVECGHHAVSCAAFGDIANGEYAIHIVNDGASRRMLLTGLPEGLEDIRVFVTDHASTMNQVQLEQNVVGASVDLILPATSFVTVLAR